MVSFQFRQESMQKAYLGMEMEHTSPSKWDSQKQGIKP